jgi:hypothetical protein
MDRATAATYVEILTTECKSIGDQIITTFLLSIVLYGRVYTPLRAATALKTNAISFVRPALQRERVTPGFGALRRTDGCMSWVYVGESGHARVQVPVGLGSGP